MRCEAARLLAGVGVFLRVENKRAGCYFSLSRKSAAAIFLLQQNSQICMQIGLNQQGKISNLVFISQQDVVTAYLYGSLDANVYMKIPEGFTFPEAMNSKPQSMYSIKL